jgi:hypothetical protein
MTKVKRDSNTLYKMTSKLSMDWVNIEIKVLKINLKNGIKQTLPQKNPWDLYCSLKKT